MRLEDLVNTTLGRYQIEALIGQGGMAAVYRAFDPALQRHVALKVLYPQYLNDTDLVERFRREAITAARLDHPHIAPIYDVGEAGGLVYLALKLLPGPSLADVLQRQGRILAAQVAQWAADIAAALDEAHRQGVVHRDIKPGNVLFDSRSRAILTDFGIAKSLDAPGLTESSVIVGTPDYIAPEQIDLRLAPNGQIDGRADIYAFGALLYRSLTGHRPFEGSGQAVLLAHLRDEPVPPSSIVASLPPAVDTVLLGAMAKNPLDRPEHASDVAAALQAALGDVTEVGTVFPPAALRQEPHLRQTTAAPVAVAAQLGQPPAPVLPDWQRPKGGLVAVVTLALLVVLSTALALWLGGRQPLALANGPASTTSTRPLPASPTQTASPTTASFSAGPTVTATPASVATSTVSDIAQAVLTTTATLPTATLVSTATSVPTAQAHPVVVPSSPPQMLTTVTPPPSTSKPTARPPATTTRPPATVTRSPTTTAVPPTVALPTALPPAATATPVLCKPLLTGGFGKLWNGNAQVRGALGCPLAGEIASPAAEQLFTGGLMYWLAATQRIYVMTPLGTGSWSVYPNTYRDGEQLVPLALAPGCIEPIRGFGKLWRNEIAVSDALGCATTPEAALSGATSGVYQRFQGGTLLYSWAVNGHGRQIYVLLRDGGYATYPDLQ